MYNCVDKYVTENNLLCKKQFGFQSSHLTDDVFLQLNDQVFQCFENDYITLGFVIDFSKALDTVNHSIFSKKLEMYGIH